MHPRHLHLAADSAFCRTDAVDSAWGNGEKLRLVVVGGRLDHDYGALVEARAKLSPGAFVLLSATLSRSGCIHAMRQCAAVSTHRAALVGVAAPRTAVIARYCLATSHATDL